MFVMAIMRHSQQNYSVFVPVVKEEMSFKAISIVALVAILFHGVFGKFDSHELNSWSSGSGANFINKVRTTYLKLCVRCFLRSAYVSFIKTS